MAKLCDSCKGLKTRGWPGGSGSGYEAKWFCDACWRQWDHEGREWYRKHCRGLGTAGSPSVLPPWTGSPAALPPDKEGDPLPVHQVLCINLEQREKRLDRFMLSARCHGLAEVARRVPAVDGQALDLDAYPRSVVVEAGVRAAARPPKMVNGVCLTRGALGLILTWPATRHNLLQEIAADTCPEHVYLVCEDDATFNAHFVRRLRAALAEADSVDPQWDFVHVGYYDDDCTLRSLPDAGAASRSLLCRPVEVYGLFGAALRPAGAEKLLEALFPLKEQIDSALAHVYRQIRALATRPSLMHAEHSAAGATDIQIIPRGHVPQRYGQRMLGSFACQGPRSAPAVPPRLRRQIDT